MKYILFIFNFLFVLTGISMITVGLITRSTSEEYKPVVQNADYDNYISAPNLLIFMGVFVFIVAFFGCCGSLKENHCMLFTFSVIMAAIFVAEVTIGITGYMLRSEVANVLTKGLNSTMYEYKTNNETVQLWDDLQESLDCCGTKSYKDWLQVLNTTSELPASCCLSQPSELQPLPSCTITSKDLHKTPCFSALGDAMRSNLSTIGFTGLAIGVVQLLGVLFSCTLARSIRKDYESV